MIDFVPSVGRCLVCSTMTGCRALTADGQLGVCATCADQPRNAYLFDPPPAPPAPATRESTPT